MPIKFLGSILLPDNIRVPQEKPGDKPIAIKATEMASVWSRMLHIFDPDFDFQSFANLYVGYIAVMSALEHLEVGNQNEVLRFLRLILRLQPATKDQETRFCESLWRMSRQKAWQQKGIQNIIAYFAKSVHTQARRLERQESAEITATAELADVVDELTPESVLAAQELLEEIRHISTPTQRRIVDMLDSGCSRQEVSITLHIKKPNLRKQISDLRKRMHI